MDRWEGRTFDEGFRTKKKGKKRKAICQSAHVTCLSLSADRLLALSSSVERRFFLSSSSSSACFLRRAVDRLLAVTEVTSLSFSFLPLPHFAPLAAAASRAQKAAAAATVRSSERRRRRRRKVNFRPKAISGRRRRDTKERGKEKELGAKKVTVRRTMAGELRNQISRQLGFEFPRSFAFPFSPLLHYDLRWLLAVFVWGRRLGVAALSLGGCVNPACEEEFAHSCLHF